MNENRLRGQLDALQGKDRNYGCHFGLKSTRDVCVTQYNIGFNEVDYFITHGDIDGRRYVG